MTFLNPLFLWLLPLISAPIIIHLLAKRKSKQIDFPSLKFLKLMEQDALKKFNVKQLILLILRTLMILLIILAFARPVMNTRGNFGVRSGSVDLLVIALDNTASNYSSLENMPKAWLKDFSIDLRTRGIQVEFCGIVDFQLGKDLKNIIPEYSDIYAAGILERLSEQLDMDQFSRKSILWVGDGQDARERMEELGDWNKYLLHLSVSGDNGVSEVKLPPRGIRVGETYALSVGIEHFPGNSEGIGLELLVNEKRQNQAVIEPGMGSVEINGRVDESGYQIGRLLSTSDGDSYNNVRAFVLPASGDVPVQVLRSAQNPDFWRIIESSVEEEALNLDIRLLDYNEIDNLNLSQGGTVIVDDASKLVDYNWSRLNTFTEGGGQLILFGNAGAYMQRMLGFKSELVREENSFPLGLVLASAAATQLQIAPLENAISQDRLKVFTRFDVKSDELSQTWIRFLDDQPFLGTQKNKAGRVIWFNTEFGLAANNLPLLGLFPTLILQLAQSQELIAQTDLYNKVVGDSLHFYPSAPDNQNLPYSIQRPDGTLDYLTPDSNYVIHYSMTNLPGIYNLARGRKLYQPVAVNISAHEAQAHRRNYQFENTDIFVSENEKDMMARIVEQRSGMALWPTFLLLLLLLWVAESYLSRIKSTWRQDV